MTTARPLAAPGRLTVRTTRLDADPGDLLDLLPADGALAWVHHGDGLVGWGEAARLEVAGPQRFAEAEAWWRALSGTAVVRDEVRVPGTGPVALGSFAFDDQGTGASVLIVPRVLVGRRDGTSWVTTVGTGGALPPAAVLPVRAPDLTTGAPVSFADGARSGAAWTGAVAEAVRRIRAGEVQKVVLARDVEALADAPVDVRDPLRRLAAGYPACWTFAVDGLLGATPEVLVRLDDGLAASRVLAGTIRRTGDDAADLGLAASLARSGKDLQEHEYAVRSVAEALARHCRAVNVPESPFVLHLPNVMHLATDVTGRVSDGSTALRLVGELHPSAAVCGTPTDVARALIRELEGMDRGRYAGPVGWVDARGDGEWCIALRCAQVDAGDPRRLRLFAGCGVVSGSQPEDELAESSAKLVPVREALGG